MFQVMKIILYLFELFSNHKFVPFDIIFELELCHNQVFLIMLYQNNQLPHLTYLALGRLFQYYKNIHPKGGI